jgi:nucleoside-diphosphate-sugar epimerase
MYVAIIGTNGFLSSAIAKFAIDKGWCVDMYGLEEPNHAYTNFYYLDLINEEINDSSFLGKDLVIYAAGAGIQSNLNENADIIYELNTFVPIKICRYLQNYNFKGRFITFGSYFELGESKQHQPVTETDIINAMTPAPTDYVISKRLLTRFVTSYKHDFVHWHFILPTICGPGENIKRLIPYTINAIKNGDDLHFTSGNQVRQYLFVGDVLMCINEAINKNLHSGVYNIEGKAITVKDLVAKITTKMGAHLDDSIFGGVVRSDTIMEYLALDGAQLKKSIGYTTPTEINEILDFYLL